MSSFKKVGVSQDSKLQGDKLRIQNPDNTFGYFDISYQGSSTASYIFPSTSGAVGQGLKIAGSNGQLEWSSQIGATGATGATGSAGTSGTSGSSGSSGSRGTSGTSGSSGSSGANGVGDATMLGDVNFVSKYVGATALGTASLTSVGDQTLFTDGSSATPSIAFQNDGNTGFYRITQDQFAAVVNGATAAIFAFTQSAPRVALGRIDFITNPVALSSASYMTADSQGFRHIVATIETLRMPQGRVLIGHVGTPTSPNLSFLQDNDTGFFVTGNNNVINISCGGATAAIIQADGIRNVSGTPAAPAYRFINDFDSGMYSITDGRIGWSVNAATAMSLDAQGLEVVDGTAAQPSYSFLNDTDTGFYRNADNEFIATVGGATAAIFSNAGSSPRIAVSRIDLTTPATISSLNTILASGLGHRFFTNGNESLRLPQGRTLIGEVGSVSAPNLSFIQDSDTGFFVTGNNNVVNVACGGATAGTFQQNALSLNTGSSLLPSYTFIGATGTGLFRTALGRVGISQAGATAAMFGATNSIATQTFFEKAVNHIPVSAITSGTYSMDMSASNVFFLTLTASTTLDYTNAQVGSYVLVVRQNATGNYALNLASNKFIGTTWSGVATASNAKSIVQVVYDGSKGIITSQKNLIDL